MAKITVSDIKVNQFLNVLLGQTNKDAFVRDRVLPKVSVVKDTGRIPMWGNKHFRIYDLKRTIGDRSLHFVESEIGTEQSYSIDRYDIAGYVDDILLENQDQPFQLLAIEAMTKRETLLLQAEDALATAMTNASVITQTTALSGTTQWSDFTNSNPFDAIEDAKTTVFNACGYEPNTIVIPREVLVVLKQHPAYNFNITKDARGLSDGEIVQIIKDKHGFNEVVVPKARKITSKEGQTETFGQVWGKSVVMFYKSPIGSIVSPSFGYTLELSTKNGGVSSRREPVADKGLIVEGEIAFQDKILMPTAGYLYTTVVA